MGRTAKWVLDAMETFMASKMPLMTVTETQYISPYIKKIRFKGSLSGMDFQLGYAVAIRVGDNDHRNYTVSFNDIEKGILEITIHLHSDAPGSRFMSNLNVGNEIRISYPRGHKQYNSSVNTQLIFGDETSLGLACAFQPVVKSNQHQFQFYFELDEENKNVPQLLGLENYTVFPKNGTFKNKQLIEQLPIFKTDGWQSGNYVLTGNAKSIQTFRNVLRDKDIQSKSILTQPYWAEGKIGL